jgi:hypothetical protein
VQIGALPLSSSPGSEGQWCGKILGVHRRALGVLFAVLAAGFAAIAVLSALHGGQAFVIALAAGVLAIWMASLARRAL